MPKQIIVDILPDGSVEIEASGFKGTACSKATAALESAMGGKVKNTMKKPEYYQSEKVGQQIGR